VAEGAWHWSGAPPDPLDVLAVPRSAALTAERLALPVPRSALAAAALAAVALAMCIALVANVGALRPTPFSRPAGTAATLETHIHGGFLGASHAGRRVATVVAGDESPAFKQQQTAAGSGHAQAFLDAAEEDAGGGDRGHGVMLLQTGAAAAAERDNLLGDWTVVLVVVSAIAACLALHAAVAPWQSRSAAAALDEHRAASFARGAQVPTARTVLGEVASAARGGRAPVVLLPPLALGAASIAVSLAPLAGTSRFAEPLPLAWIALALCVAYLLAGVYLNRAAARRARHAVVEAMTCWPCAEARRVLGAGCERCAALRALERRGRDLDGCEDCDGKRRALARARESPCGSCAILRAQIEAAEREPCEECTTLVALIRDTRAGLSGAGCAHCRASLDEFEAVRESIAYLEAKRDAALADCRSCTVLHARWTDATAETARARDAEREARAEVDYYENVHECRECATEDRDARQRRRRVEQRQQAVAAADGGGGSGGGSGSGGGGPVGRRRIEANGNADSSHTQIDNVNTININSNGSNNINDVNNNNNDDDDEIADQQLYLPGSNGVLAARDRRRRLLFDDGRPPCPMCPVADALMRVWGGEGDDSDGQGDLDDGDEGGGGGGGGKGGGGRSA
jgi:hypothetical protein